MKAFKITSVARLAGILLLLAVFQSCKSKEDRINQLTTIFPKSQIIDVDTEKGNGWCFIVNDTISHRTLFVKCYADGDLLFKEFFLK